MRWGIRESGWLVLWATLLVLGVGLLLAGCQDDRPAYTPGHDALAVVR